jgi:hypothetical protein
MEERLENLRRQLGAAIADFDGSLAIHTNQLDALVADAVMSGQAQKFEFTIELFWKTAKLFLLELHGLDIPSPKPVVKKYSELGYIDYGGLDRLLRAIEIRNSLSHVYRKDAFLDLHKEIVDYRGFFLAAAEGIMQG